VVQEIGSCVTWRFRTSHGWENLSGGKSGDRWRAWVDGVKAKPAVS
jgi:hypothetical protein